MTGYSTSDVASMLDLSVAQVRSFARAGFFHPRRGPRGEYRFSFQDLVLLRAAKGLTAADISPRKIRRALLKLKAQLPSGRPLSAVQIAAEGDEIVVRDGRSVWSPESGQTYFDFDVAELVEKVAPLARKAAEDALESEQELGSSEWFELGLELETAEPDFARDAYRRCLELDPAHPDAHVNLGRLLHEAGLIEAAAAHYRLALEKKPDDPTATFNLGVSLEDMGLPNRARQCYERVLAVDPAYADAHFNLARLFEKQGDTPATLRHLNSYRRLTREH